MNGKVTFLGGWGFGANSKSHDFFYNYVFIANTFFPRVLKLFSVIKNM
jgi:hypothetical protein